MLQPKRLKHPKSQKGKTGGLATRGTKLAFGSYGLRAMGTKWITSRQIEAARMCMVRNLKKKGKLWIRIFPQHPITTKGTEFPMGGGKGKVFEYVFPITPGRIVFELEGIDETKAREVLKKAGAKLPIRTQFVVR